MVIGHRIFKGRRKILCEYFSRETSLLISFYYDVGNKTGLINEKAINVKENNKRKIN